MIETTNWTNCYGGQWKNLVVPEAFAHPAKFSRTLIQRIYQHAFAEGWLVPGVSTVLDPFSGVALGAHDGALAGVQWVGCELEPRFVALAQANIDLWQRKYGHLPQWVTPICVQGDSRELLRVLSGAGVDMALSSPPYADGCRQMGHDTHPERMVGTRTGYLQRDGDGDGYGTTPGNLGNMASGTVEAVISSPPWMDVESQMGTGDIYAWAKREAQGYADGSIKGHGATEEAIIKRLKRQREAYGAHPDQIGNTHGDTFWAASRTILEQCCALLVPGGHAIWIVKSYCRDGAIVDFPGQWRAVCEDVGFVTLHEHHAMLVETYGTQGGLFGEDTVHQTARKSFFRRLHEAKRPDLAIDYEVVLCMQKPGGGGEGERHGVEACISSPPWIYTSGGCRLASNPDGFLNDAAFRQRHAATMSGGYGSTPGQLGTMPPGTAPDQPKNEGVVLWPTS